MDPTYNNKPDLEKVSHYFPPDLKSPFKAGVIELREGVNKLKQGNIAGISQVTLGLLGCIPVVSHSIYSIRHQLSLLSPDTIIEQRRNHLTQEINSYGVGLQQVFFETHNSKLLGGLEKVSPLRKILDFSYPDRQLVILISDLEEFQKKCTPAEIENIEIQLNLLKKMEPLAIAVTCYILARNQTERQALRTKASQIISEHIISLAENEVAILPFGYAQSDVHNLFQAGSPGHVALMEVSKKEGRTILRVFNSGDGITHHPKVSEGRYQPLVVEDLDLTNRDKEVLDRFITNILALSGDNFLETYEDIKKESEGRPVINDRVSKAYRNQLINNCSKKSLQIWLHDRLQDKPVLYQKFRIFALERRKKFLTNLINICGEGPLPIEHSVLLWGGSDRVENTVHNLYFKVRGFVTGPQVIDSVERRDLLEMETYCRKIKLSRLARLELLHGSPESAIDVIKELPLFERWDVLKGLRQFCTKLDLDCADKISNKFSEAIFSNQEILQFINDPEFTKLDPYIADPFLLAMNNLFTVGIFIGEAGREKLLVCFLEKLKYFQETYSRTPSISYDILRFYKNMIFILHRQNVPSAIINEFIKQGINACGDSIFNRVDLANSIHSFNKVGAENILLPLIIQNKDVFKFQKYVFVESLKLTEQLPEVTSNLVNSSLVETSAEQIQTLMLLLNPNNLNTDEKKKWLVQLVNNLIKKNNLVLSNALAERLEENFLEKLGKEERDLKDKFIDHIFLSIRETKIEVEHLYLLIVLANKISESHPECAEELNGEILKFLISVDILNLEKCIRFSRGYKLPQPDLIADHVIEQLPEFTKGNYVSILPRVIQLLFYQDPKQALRIKESLLQLLPQVSQPTQDRLRSSLNFTM